MLRHIPHSSSVNFVRRGEAMFECFAVLAIFGILLGVTVVSWSREQIFWGSHVILPIALFGGTIGFMWLIDTLSRGSSPEYLKGERINLPFTIPIIAKSQHFVDSDVRESKLYTIREEIEGITFVYHQLHNCYSIVVTVCAATWLKLITHEITLCNALEEALEIVVTTEDLEFHNRAEQVDNLTPYTPKGNLVKDWTTLPYFICPDDLATLGTKISETKDKT